MVKFDEKNQVDSVNGALALRPEIESIVDRYLTAGIRNLCWLGIGGTWASCLQVVCHMKESTDMDVFAANAAEYCATGDLRIGEGTLVVISSVTGTTAEVVDAVKLVRQRGAQVLGFIDKPDSELAGLVDECISYKSNEQLKFFMTADYILYRQGRFQDYAAYYAQLEAHLAKDLVEIEKQTDSFAEEFARKHMNDALHYFVGAGCLYGATYSYAMCYWEEMHWIRTKSIHSAEFFHGMLEVVDLETPITVFVGEDSQRELGLRVAKFLPRVCKNYTVIDTRDYPLEGIDDVYRGRLCHLVLHAVTNRIDAHLEALSGHDMTIRRYYRKVDY